MINLDNKKPEGAIAGSKIITAQGGGQRQQGQIILSDEEKEAIKQAAEYSAKFATGLGSIIPDNIIEDIASGKKVLQIFLTAKGDGENIIQKIGIFPGNQQLIVSEKALAVTKVIPKGRFTEAKGNSVADLSRRIKHGQSKQQETGETG